MTPYETFERIKIIAKKRGLSLVEVNDKAGLGTRSIYHWKTKTPTTNNLKAVAEVLRTTPNYLNGETDDPSIPKDQEEETKSRKISYADLGLPYKGVVSDDLNDMYRAMAEQFAEKHHLPKRDE